MSKNITEDHWKRRYEKLECRMNEMLAKKDEKLAKKDEKIAQLEEKVNRLEGLFTNAINQIKALTLELIVQKKLRQRQMQETLVQRPARKKAIKNLKNLKASTNEPVENVPPI